MPSDDWRAWHGRRRWGRSGQGGRRPPWWPEGEAWPPADAAAREALRRGFARRAALFVVVALAMFATVIVLLGWLLGTIFRGHAFWGFIPAVLFVLLVVGGLRLVRGVGQAATPLGDLVEASSRVEAGQFGTQVEVRGPREIQALARAFNAMSARLAADEAQRRRLLADVSHELRTPLTVIQGGIEGVMDGLYPPDREHLEPLLAEARHLERLVEDLRTLSLADAGALPLQREPIDLGALARETVAGFAAAAASAGVDLSATAEPDLPALELDPHRIRQVIGNLLANALRHTPRGGRVTVRVAREQGAVLLEVADSGSGMEADAAARAFDRFWRAGEGAGAGLGLAIVRDLVRAHGGEVELISQAGQGTRVSARFPMASG